MKISNRLLKSTKTTMMIRKRIMGLTILISILPMKATKSLALILNISRVFSMNRMKF